MEKPLISVVIPCYNQAHYLPETLQTVLEQTYQNWECIIVNDGSPDNTEEVAQLWCGRDARFRYLKKENGGLSDARNAGITQTKGEWILPLDSDDKIGEEYLERAVEVMNNTPNVGLIYCKANFFGEFDGPWNLKDYDYKRILYSNCIFCSAFYRKEDWEKVGGYDTNMKDGREDWEFWINLLSTLKKEVVRLDYLGFFYRQKPDNSVDRRLNSMKGKVTEIENYIFEKYKNVYRENFGSFQSVLFEKLLLEEELEFRRQKQLKIQNNIISRYLYKIINHFI